MKDRWGRTIDYLRLSLTDRCNLRCRYCMPDDVESVGHDAVLRYEEMMVVCQASLTLGIDRFKITGGEPFVRRGAVDFMRALKGLDGVRSVTVTTNGMLLEKALPDLVDLGIDGINISLDTLDAEQYHRLTGGGDLSVVVSALQAAVKAGVNVKVNAVLLAATRNQILNLAKFAQTWPLTSALSNSCRLALVRHWQDLPVKNVWISCTVPIRTLRQRMKCAATDRQTTIKAGSFVAVSALLLPIRMLFAPLAIACA